MSKPPTPWVRPMAAVLEARLRERRRFIQVVAGARQVGKTTLVQTVVERLAVPVHFTSADEPTLRGPSWLAQQWDTAREADTGDGAVLVVDEIQKVQGWPEAVKRLWDEDTRRRRRVKVVLLGSAPLLVEHGLSESLAGRFEIVHLPHWSFAEMHSAFGWTLEQFVYFGGYPGAAPLIGDEPRWRRYIRDSLVETSIARDVLLLSRVDKPALLRRLFELSCQHSGQILSYTKMLGQLHDAGNATTLAHYLELLAGAGMVTGLQKFSGSVVKRRGSIPKLQVLDNALISALSAHAFAEARQDREHWGRLVESTVGAHLANAAAAGDFELYYWRDRNREVDFVAQRGKRVVAIEVKSSRARDGLPGMDALAASHRVDRAILVAEDGIPLERFLTQPMESLFTR